MLGHSKPSVPSTLFFLFPIDMADLWIFQIRHLSMSLAEVRCTTIFCDSYDIVATAIHDLPYPPILSRNHLLGLASFTLIVRGATVSRVLRRTALRYALFSACRVVLVRAAQ